MHDNDFTHDNDFMHDNDHMHDNDFMLKYTQKQWKGIGM